MWCLERPFRTLAIPLVSLAAGQTANWTISVPVDRLNLPSSAADFGAYPLAVDARTTAGRTVASTRLPTTLLWMPTGAQFTPTQISWLVPLVDGIHRGNGDTFLDDQLATDLSPTGRLGRLLSLASAARVPITYAIDPALVDDATVMAGAAQLSAGVTGVTGVAPPSDVAGSPGATPTPAKTSGSPKQGSKSASAPPTAAAPTPYQVAADANSTGTTNGTGEAVGDGLARHAARRRRRTRRGRDRAAVRRHRLGCRRAHWPDPGNRDRPLYRPVDAQRRPRGADVAERGLAGRWHLR